MKNKTLIMLIIALVFIVSYCVSYGVSKHQYHHGAIDSHEWLHKNLKLTDEQEKKLTPIEERYASKKKEISAKLSTYNNQLADLLEKNHKISDEVKEIIKKIDNLQAELQMATLDHIFEMQTILDEEQSKKLMELTIKALRIQK